MTTTIAALPAIRTFTVRVKAYTESVTRVEAERVRRSVSHDNRSVWVSRVSHRNDHYCVNFEAECPCTYVDHTLSPYVDWQQCLDYPLPENCEIYDYYIH